MEVKKHNLSQEVKEEKIQALVAKKLGDKIQERRQAERREWYPHFFEQTKTSTTNACK